jgi:hypothetical protein
VVLEETARVFCTDDGRPYYLYRHQAEALERARAGDSYVVTSGTGSGKSLTYFLPIIDTLLRQPATGDRVVALVVYPMNALVNSQLAALQKLKEGYERRTGRAFPATFAKYTGETRDAGREELRQHPPQILLTNYVMAELLLVRPEDQRFLDRAGGGLRFLVFDELHTYRGRHGADVAMLIRRLKERCAAPGLVHVGTSATMVADRHAGPETRRAAVADFATRLFGHRFTPEHVIEETLVTFTQGGPPSGSELAAALASPLPATLDEFRCHQARAAQPRLPCYRRTVRPGCRRPAGRASRCVRVTSPQALAPSDCNVLAAAPPRAPPEPFVEQGNDDLRLRRSEVPAEGINRLPHPSRELHVEHHHSRRHLGLEVANAELRTLSLDHMHAPSLCCFVLTYRGRRGSQRGTRWQYASYSAPNWPRKVGSS